MSNDMIVDGSSNLGSNVQTTSISCIQDILNQFPQPWNQLLSYSANNNSPYSIDIERWLGEDHGKAGLDWNALVKALSRNHSFTSVNTCQTNSLPVLLWLPLQVQRSLLYYIHRHYYSINRDNLMTLIKALHNYTMHDSWNNVLLRMLEYDISKSTISSNHTLTMSLQEIKESFVADNFKNYSSQLCDTLKAYGRIQLLDLTTQAGYNSDNDNINDTSRSTSPILNKDNHIILYHDTDHHPLAASVVNNQPIAINSPLQTPLSDSQSSNTGISNKRKAIVIDSDTENEGDDCHASSQKIKDVIQTQSHNVIGPDFRKICDKLKELLNNEDVMIIEKMNQPDYRNSFSVLLTSSAQEMEAVYQHIDFSQFSLEKLATICRLYCDSPINAQLDNCLYFCRQSIYPHLLALSSSASRLLFYCVECFLKRYSESLMDGCCLELWNNELRPAQVEFIKTLIDTTFQQDHCLYFLTKIIHQHSKNLNKLKWNENHYAIIQCIIQKRLQIDSKIMLELLSTLYQNALDMASSTIFITLIINIINYYKEQVIPYVDLLDQILQPNKTVLKKSTLAKVKRLRSH